MFFFKKNINIHIYIYKKNQKKKTSRIFSKFFFSLAFYIYGIYIYLWAFNKIINSVSVLCTS